MEEDNKRRMICSFPPNYVTLLQLQERWINEQNRKKNKEKQLEPDPESKPQEHGEIGDVVEKTEVAVCLASCETADKKIETEELRIVKRKWRRNWSKNGKSKVRAQAATGVAEVAGCEENAPQTKEAIVKSRNRRRLRKMSTDGEREREKVGSETKPEEAVCLVSCETADKKIKTEELKIVTRKWRRNWSKNSKSKARAQAATGVAEVAGCEENAPQMKEAIVKSRNRRLRKMSTDGGREEEIVGSETKLEGAVCLVSCQITDKMEKTRKSKKNQGKEERKKAKEKRDDEEVAGGEAYAPKTSDGKFEMAKSGNAVVADRTVEIQWRLKDMSIKGGRERRNDTPPRPNNGGHYRGGYGRFDNGRRSGHEEWKPRNARMIWVKKGDTSGCNADEFHSSIVH